MEFTIGRTTDKTDFYIDLKELGIHELRRFQIDILDRDRAKMGIKPQDWCIVAKDIMPERFKLINCGSYIGTSLNKYKISERFFYFKNENKTIL